jgi:glycosyltransferase involved in cell wall biosynthesis
MSINIGFVGTRFAGLDGVSLESEKWAHVLRKMKHRLFWFGGEVEKPPECSTIVPEAHFRNERNVSINNEVYGKRVRSRSTTDDIHRLKEHLKNKLYEFIERFRVELLIAENCLSIPLHIPLGVALTEVIAETGIPAIAHHHDLPWERDRFLVNAVSDYLDMAFPPDLPSARHVVINTVAQEELASRKGIPSHLIPNVLDFDANPKKSIDPVKRRRFREDFGFRKDDIIFLQPTRIVARKGIEHSIDLVRRLNDPKIKLVITHSSGDEGLEYQNWIIKTASEKSIPVFFINNRLHAEPGHARNGQRSYTLWDIYPHADFITYPSSFEGFGNAFLEAIYYKKPVLVNRYPIFVADIEPRGFDVVVMDGHLTDEVVFRVNLLLSDPSLVKQMTDKNFRVARAFFSYDLLKRRLTSVFTSFYGMIKQS